MAARERYLIPAKGDDLEAVFLGVTLLLELCERFAQPGLIFVPIKQNVKNSMLSKVLSEEQIKLLISGKAVNTSSGQPISLCSHLTYRNHNRSPIVLAIWASKDVIADIEKQPHCQAMVVVPWIAEDTVDWKRQRFPIVMGRTN